MSAVWPLPDDIREPDHPDEYRADDVDEMTAGGLAILAEVRRRIEAELVWLPAATARVLAVVDGYARETIEAAGGDGDALHDYRDDCVCPDCFNDGSALAEAARHRS